MPGVLIQLAPQARFQSCLRLRKLLVLAHPAQRGVGYVAGVTSTGIDQPPDVSVQEARRLVALVGRHFRRDEMVPTFLVGGSGQF